MDKISGVIKLGLRHSTAQAFLIFSGLLIVVSMVWAPQYVAVSFFTFFYATIVHSLTVLRKNETWGNAFVGGDKLKVVLFALTLYNGLANSDRYNQWIAKE